MSATIVATDGCTVLKLGWKSLRNLLRPGQWPAMTWVILAMAVVISAATVFVGAELGAVARQPVTIDTR